MAKFALAHQSDPFDVEPFTVDACSVEYYRVPLEEALEDASHGIHTHFELILCRIKGSNGIEGEGYTYTGGKGGRAIATLIAEDMAPLLMGSDGTDIEAQWEALQTAFHYVGRGGLLSFALSALDIALWDIRCKALNMPLYQVAGGAETSCRCYAGFIDLNYSLDKLLSHAQAHLDQGFTALKTKVGHADYRTDVDRVKALRDLMGPERQLMVDANYSFSVAQAVAFSNAIDDQDITWFEEPISPDAFEDFGRIAQLTKIPLAMGENLHTIDEFKRAIRYARLGFLQPDASNIGGITGWVRIAAMAAKAGIPICSHGMHELHVSLLASQPHAGWLEVHAFPIDAYTDHPLARARGRAFAPKKPGTGVRFDRQKLAPHLMSEVSV